MAWRNSRTGWTPTRRWWRFSTSTSSEPRVSSRARANTQARSASEGMKHPRLRFGLVLKPQGTGGGGRFKPITSLERRYTMRWMMMVVGAALLLGAGMTQQARAEEPPIDPKAKQFKVQGKFTEVTNDNGEKNERTTRVPALFIVEARRLTFRSGGAPALVPHPVI